MVSPKGLQGKVGPYLATSLSAMLEAVTVGVSGVPVLLFFSSRAYGPRPACSDCLCAEASEGSAVVPMPPFWGL